MKVSDYIVEYLIGDTPKTNQTYRPIKAVKLIDATQRFLYSAIVQGVQCA